MTYTLDQITVGATITATSWLGGTVTGTVTDVYPEIKNGRPGVDYDLAGGDAHPSRWCYLDQIIRVA